MLYLFPFVRGIPIASARVGCPGSGQTGSRVPRLLPAAPGPVNPKDRHEITSQGATTHVRTIFLANDTDATLEGTYLSPSRAGVD